MSSEPLQNRWDTIFSPQRIDIPKPINEFRRVGIKKVDTQSSPGEMEGRSLSFDTFFYETFVLSGFDCRSCVTESSFI